MAVDSIALCVSFNKCQSDKNSHATTMKNEKNETHAYIEIIDFDDDNSINVVHSSTQRSWKVKMWE